MGFRESIAAKAFELFEGLGRELLLVAVGDHAGDELVAKGGDATGELEGRHALPELVGLAWRETGADNGDAHALLLKQWHTQRLAKNLFQLRLRVDDGLNPFAPA